MMVRLYMQVWSRDSDNSSRHLAYPVTNRYVLPVVLRLGLFVLLVFSPQVCASPETTKTADTIGKDRPAQLTRRLEDLIRQLRELRSDYYRKRTEFDAQIQKARQNRETLQAEAEGLRQQEAELDRQLQQYNSEVQDLSQRLDQKASLQRVVDQKLSEFLADQRTSLENGIPYKQQDRLGRLAPACSDSNDPGHGSVASKLGHLWSYAQEELRLARSSETYSAPAPASNGASPHARYFRVGQVILGYVTEDGQQVGMWSPLSEGPRRAGTHIKGWLLISDPRQSRQVHAAVEILDRHRAPELVILPVTIRSKSSAGGQP